MRVIYHPHAEAELIEAAQYYERRMTTLGVRYLDDADRAVAMIRDAPQRWRVLETRRKALSHAALSICDLLPGVS